MKIPQFSFLVCTLVLGACSTQPIEKNATSLSLNESLNAKSFSLQGEKFLPTVSVFFPYGGILDVRAGSMPFYWLSKNSDEPNVISRDTTTMIHFETGERRILKDTSNGTKIKRITYGTYSKTAYENFLNSLIENEYVLDIEIDGNNPEDVNKAEQTTTSVQGNNNQDTSKKLFSTDGTSVPYMIFAYNKNDASQFQIVSPANILDFKNKKNIENIEFFLAAYPSIYIVMPGDDLANYYDLFDNKVKHTNLNNDYDCDGFLRNPKNSQLTKTIEHYRGNCPTLKFWMVNYLITAKAVKYLNKSTILNELSSGVSIPDNSLNVLNKLLWNRNDGKTVKISYIKKSGNLLTSSLQLNDRKINIFPLAWDCNSGQNNTKCIPAGPSGTDKESLESISEDIPIYAILNFKPDQMSNLINGVPKFDIKHKMVSAPFQ